jgi:hypothetical protein
LGWILCVEYKDCTEIIPGPVPGLAPSEFEARMMVDYVKFLHKELGSSTPPGNGSSNRQGSSSPPSSTSPQESALNALGMSRLTLWNLCNNNTSVVPPTQEPQKEALNLEVREQQARALQDSIVKREGDESVGPPPPKRLLSEEDNMKMHSGVAGTHIKIASRGKYYVTIVVPKTERKAYFAWPAILMWLAVW